MYQQGLSGTRLFSWLSFGFKHLLPLVVSYLIFRVYQKRSQSLRLKRLQGQVVLITGASSGLGEALTKLFYKSGCRLILVARNRSKLEELKNVLTTQTNINCQTYDPVVLEFDLSDLEDVKNKARSALKIHGHIDMLINNGGISYRGNAATTAIAVDQHLMLVNYFGQIVLTREILPQMVARNVGHIVNIGSVQARIGIPFRSSYAASKHAFQAFSDCLRAELTGTNVRLCVVNPGYINTNLSLNALVEDGSKYGIIDQKTALGMSPREVAEAVQTAILNNKKELLLCSFQPKAAIFLRFFWPELYFYLMKKRAEKQKSSLT